MRDRGGVLRGRRKAQAFFFEKKKQKTFVRAVAVLFGDGGAADRKISFLVKAGLP
jgi:hypothetical protein